jgi:hypothetical protein
MLGIFNFCHRFNITSTLDNAQLGAIFYRKKAHHIKYGCMIQNMGSYKNPVVSLETRSRPLFNET